MGLNIGQKTAKRRQERPKTEQKGGEEAKMRRKRPKWKQQAAMRGVLGPTSQWKMRAVDRRRGL